MSPKHSAARNLLLFSFTLLSIDHISANVIAFDFEPEGAAIISPEQVFDSHVGRSRVARSTLDSSLLSNWQMADTAFREINDKLKVYDVRSTDAGVIRCNLAVSLGRLTDENAKLLDSKLKVMIAGTLRTFNRDPTSTRTWHNILGTMKSNPLLQEVNEAHIHREHGYTINEVNHFKFDGSPDPVKVAEFKRWFTRFLNDNDVLQDTTIDVDELAGIMSETGARIVSFGTFFARHDVEEKNIIDIGILRFPDIDDPFMKIYRIQLKVRRSSRRILYEQHDQNAVEGIFDSAKFKPRESTMARLRPEIFEQADRDIDEIFYIRR